MLKGSFNRLLASVQTIKGIGPATAAKLRDRGVETLEDALFFLPTRYQDRRRVSPIVELKPGDEVVIQGRVVSAKVSGPPGRNRRFLLTLDDGSAKITALWFHAHLAGNKALEPGRTATLAGKIGSYKDRLTMNHPELIADPSDAATGLGRFVPVYRDIPGVSTKIFRRLIRTVLDLEMARVDSPLPEGLATEQGLLEPAEAFERVHFPETEADVTPDGPPRRTLIFTELFLHQACLAWARKMRRSGRAPVIDTLGLVRAEVGPQLPFTLTQAQERVLDDLIADLAVSRPMSRLLQGDVGSGKTVVAALALIAAAQAGCQGALMAPTEILAAQHYRNLKALTDKARITLALLTGSTPARDRKSILKGLAEGSLRLIVGTHALFQEGVDYRDLGLAIIDEQHRFGVAQRAALAAKGPAPHNLVMTATPIPRSLALTLYGDLDVSILDEKPAGRREVVTRILPRSRIERAWQAVAGAADQGLQSFVVLPAIDAQSELASARTRFAELKKALPELRLGLVHGRLDREEMNQTMAAFAAGELDVLVATTVIEVGLDVPKAAVMIIEDAERFGLAQIHQLRGRVGRGETPAACLLISDAGGDSRARLKKLEKTEDGFLIAEEDMKMRGPGEIMGSRQAGWPDFRLANLITDARLLAKARKAAFSLVAADPDLQQPEHKVLADIVTRRASLWSRAPLTG